MNKKTIRDIDVMGKRVLVRVDFNVPQDDSGGITDDRRIRAALPTIQYLMHQGARTLLVSHLGRPKGNPGDASKFTLLPVAHRLAELLGTPVPLADDCVGAGVEALAAGMHGGEVALLQNVRLHPEEEQNDPAFSTQLARLADLYVNDAFGTAHRAHASTEGVAHLLPSVAGLLIEKELAYLGAALTEPVRPFVAILGGVKVHDKIRVIESLLPRVDRLLIGGAMAYTFYKAQGLNIGKSILDETSLEFCRKVAAEAGDKLQIPTDCVVAASFSNSAAHHTVPVTSIPPDMEGVDIGPQTSAHYRDIVKTAGTVIWNGPMGVFEMPNFAAGTYGVAQAMAEATDRGCITIVGGGDSAAAVEQMGFADRMVHVSTGGGASLEFLEGRDLPGISALNDRSLL